MQKIKNILRNERGLTLIELLAVVVILAIIAAIAIPAIGGLMDNTKKDAHVANAEQMVSSARMYLTGDATKGTGTATVTLQELIDGGYMEDLEDPNKKGYDKTGSKVNFTAGKVTTVTLGNSERGIPATAPKDLERSRVSPSGKLSGATTP